MASIRQKKAIAHLVENGGSVADAMRAGGYADGTIKNPSKLTSSKSFQEEVLPFLKKLEKERDRLVTALSAKSLEDVDYKDMVDSVDKLTKNIQLLNGGKTSNDKMVISWEE